MGSLRACRPPLASAVGGLNGWDTVFVLSSSLRVMGKVGEEVLGDGLIGVIHPGYHDEENSGFPYERRSASAAHVPAGHGSWYFTGAVQGGKRADLVQALRGMAAMRSADQEAGLEAVWKTESYWNRYLVDVVPSRALDPGFGRPQYQAEEFPLKMAVVPERCRQQDVN